jgi:LAO/AO transport system kinase
MNISPADTLVAAVAGDRLALARSLTLYESGELDDDDLGAVSEVAQIPSTHDFPVLGITGAPGVGKSCIIDHIVQAWSAAGHRVAVIAVDPTSPITGGALLGDRLRMSTADSADNIYFRSIATRRHSGSVPSVVKGMLIILRAAGWNRCIVETVGAGQGEIRVAAVADRIVLLEAPGRGDGVQAEKAGLVELADLIVVNKADMAGAEKTADEIRQALEVATIPTPAIILASATTGDGIDEMLASIESLEFNHNSARARAREGLRALWEQELLDHEEFDDLLDEVVAGNLSVEAALGKIR